MTQRTLNPSEFGKALHKGLGRALQVVGDRRMLVDEVAFLDACLHNRAYDPQCEGDRAAWLIEMLDAAAASERLRPEILGGFAQTTDTWDLDQLCGFAQIYARRGCTDAHEALYKIFRERPDPTAPWLGAEEIVNLDGLPGFLKAAEQRAAESRKNDWWRDFDDLVDCADELFGAGQVDEVVEEAASGNPVLDGFREGLQAHRENQKTVQATARSSRADRMQAIPAQQIIEEISASEPEGTPRYPYAIWGRHAAEEDLQVLEDAMFSETQPARLANYLRIFRSRALPRFDERLIALASHRDDDVREGALDALAMNTHGAVRALALSRLERGMGDSVTLGLVARNYRPGDHKLIEAVLHRSDDEEAIHDVVWSLQEIFIDHEAPDGLGALLFGYEQTPCSQCRARIVEHLVERELMAPDIREECHHDANAEIRALVT